MLDDITKKEMVNELYNETGRLSEFVENILYMTRLSAQNNVLNLQKELVEDLLGAVKERVVNRLGDHVLEIIDSGSMMITVDGQLIIQVLTNLVDNAIKHTHPQSSISVLFQMKSTHYIFEVVDNGGGIPEAHLDHIFEEIGRASCRERV